jgi:hypothetical protein
VQNEDITSTSVAYIDSAILVEGSYCPPIDPPQLKTTLRDIGVQGGMFSNAASGDQTITGISFAPSVVFFLAFDNINTNVNMSVGFDIKTEARCMLVSKNATEVGGASMSSIHVKRDSSNSLKGRINELTSDGFVIDWTLTGTCACTIIFLALP